MSNDPVRWYRLPFVWLLIALPLTSVILGFILLTLAVRTDDGLVEDDYYRRGKEINRVLARDQRAVARGLEGRLALDATRHELSLALHARDGESLPSAVEIKFLHATRGGYDRVVILPRTGAGAYRAPLPELAPGRWNVQLAAADWRLTGSLVTPGAVAAVLRPGAP